MSIPLPDFWIGYFAIFWVLTGITATPPIFQHKGYSLWLGLVIGIIIGIVSGAVFMLLLALANPLIDTLDQPMLGTVVAIIVAAAAIIAGLGVLKNYIPSSDGQPKSEGAPHTAVDYSSRVDKVHPNWRVTHAIRASVVIMLAALTLIPVVWMGMTAFKSRSDAVASPPKVIFEPTMEGFISLLYDRRQLNEQQIADYRERDDLDWKDEIMLERGQAITGPSDYVKRLRNSVIIAGTSTILSVVLGVLAAYAFSRFDVPGEGDLLFFILSTRMLPPVVVTIPIFLMYRELGMYDTYLGMILLYTAFNLSFSVWLLKGFIDEIPREYEEAALVDGYTRLQAFIRIVLPQAVTGIAATTVFSFIFAWNEYAFALMLTADTARTAPPSIPSVLGTGGIEWAAIAAGSLGFLIPVVLVTFALRRYLLRGVTFGAIRQG